MVRSVNCIAHNNAGCLAVHRTSRRLRQAIISQHRSTALGTVPIATSQERLLSIAGLSSADACRSVRLLSRGCLPNGAPNVIPAARHAHSRTIASHRTFSTAVRPVICLILQAPTRQRCRSHATSARRRNISPRAEGRNWLVSFRLRSRATRRKIGLLEKSPARPRNASHWCIPHSAHCTDCALFLLFLTLDCSERSASVLLTLLPTLPDYCLAQGHISLTSGRALRARCRRAQALAPLVRLARYISAERPALPLFPHLSHFSLFAASSNVPRSLTRKHFLRTFQPFAHKRLTFHIAILISATRP